MSFYSGIAIAECGEELVQIPDTFAFTNPHLYVSLGAPYGERSPYYLRSGVLERLELALQNLQTQYPKWRIKIFDAYRPVAVQEFMVNYTKLTLAKAQNLDVNDPSQERELLEQVYKFWAVPSLDPTSPPPHSTGAAVDVTLVDQNNCEIDMGGAIDEISERSFPDFYRSEGIQNSFAKHRYLLAGCMTNAGFQRHPNEWWHFSYGDQMWCFANLDKSKVANYGRV
jgi:zinc D-Ala-D-Ala dipeptidase